MYTCKMILIDGKCMFLGKNSTTDYSKNRLRITIDVGDMNADSVLYLVTRKIALYTGTGNATGFTCQLQTQTYAQYNTNAYTFSNHDSAFSLGGWSGWNTYPINFTLGGYNASNQTNSSSTRIKAIRLLFSQTGGTGNGFISRIRLYGETAYRTTSQYATNNHIYTINENQDATFPSKIIKEGGTSSQFLMANGDTPNVVDLIYPVGSIYMSVNSTSPATLFGGTWQQIKDTFLLACGDTYSSDGDVATAQHGSADATLVSHNHGTSTTGEAFVTSENGSANNTRVAYSSSGTRYVDGMTDDSTPFHHRVGTGYVGVSATGKNMPPYMAVYVWKRTA